ncbi:MAG: S46 family peptidase [Bacteroidia bacterium]
MFKKFIVTIIACFTLLAGQVRADEGMWLPILINRNIQDMQKMGLQLSAEEIYSVNKSSLKDAIVNFGGFCTGEIVSDKGLIFTNHHCGYDAIRELSTVQDDILTNGFWAKNNKEERPAPGLTVTFMVSMEDVTGKILSALDDTMSAQARQAKITEITNGRKAEATKETHYTADVKSMFAGNAYYLFIYEVFKDIRLVGTPPEAVGKYGGDTDNWMWPRHTGDFSVFRVYAGTDNKPAEYSESNIPFKPRHFLPVSVDGVKKDDFAMIMGYPGTTTRYMTSHGIALNLSATAPITVKVRDKKLEIIRETMDKSDELRLMYASEYAQTSNYWKYYIGQSKGLKRLRVEDQKRTEEQSFLTWVNADPKRKEKYSELMNNVGKAYGDYEKYATVRTYLIEAIFQGPSSLFFAFNFQGLEQQLKNKASKEEIQASVDELRPAVKEHFANYDYETDKKLFAEMLKMYYEGIPVEFRPAIFDIVQKKYKGDFNKFAENAYRTSIFATEDRVNKFLNNPGAKAIGKDLIYQTITSVYGEYREKILPHTRGFDATYNQLAKQYIAALMEMNPGINYYPDANFTQRITYGKVADYKPMDAVHYDYISYAEGILEKEDPTNDEFIVPSKLSELIRKKDFGRYADENGRLPVNFIADLDITGGNSGSPVINGRGELIGIAFDGNWEAMSGDIAYDKELKRTISVDARYVLFIIEKLGGAKNIIDELKIVQTSPKAQQPQMAPATN